MLGRPEFRRDRFVPTLERPHRPRRFGRPFAAALITAAVLALGGCATTAGGSAVPAYERLVAALEAERSDAWASIDPAFLALPDFSDRLERLGILHSRASSSTALDDDTMDRLSRDMLALYYGDLQAHEMRHRLALAEGASTEAAFHRKASDAIAAAIAASGDGSAERPYVVLSSAQAYAWLETRRTEVVGALYNGDDAENRLLLVLKVRAGEGDPLEEMRFDLTPTFRAGVEAAGAIAGGSTPRPSDFISTRAQQGDSAAQTAYAIELWQQAPEFGPRAVQWLQAASEAGNLIAREMLGVIYGSLAAGRTGEEAERLLDAAVDQFLLAVGQGSSSAMYNLAQLYLSGHFGEENQPAGVALLRQASDRGNLDAMVMLARLHYNGQFVQEDVPAALALLVQASERGHPEAQLFYARHQLSTDDGAGFDARALGWLREAASAGTSPPAMMLLATLLAEGEHAPRDPASAVRWFKRAAASTEDAELINSVAWILVVAEDLELRDPPEGLRLMDALMSGNLEAASNPAYLDTWAAACAANGDFSRAVDVQQRAVTLAEAEGSPDYLPVLREHLELFRDGGTVTEDVP
jgi:TPR repeat protein